MKSSLEKFNLSIKELKSNVQKDKIEKDKKINELEQIFNNKINELNQEILTKNLSKEEKDEKSFDIIIEDIFNKIEKQNEYIEDIKKEMEENDINQRNDINNNNKIFMEKENELAKLITEKFDDFIKRIKKEDEKNIELENNFNDKINDLDNKTNICFNELIKKINAKNNNYKQNSQQENDLTEQLNEVINNLLQENENLEKRLESKFEEKINELMINNIKTLEEKINLLEKNSEEKTNKKRKQHYVKHSMGRTPTTSADSRHYSVSARSPAAYSAEYGRSDLGHNSNRCRYGKNGNSICGRLLLYRSVPIGRKARPHRTACAVRIHHRTALGEKISCDALYQRAVRQL